MLGSGSFKSAMPLLPFVLTGVFRVMEHVVGFLVHGSLEKIEVKKRNYLEFFMYCEILLLNLFSKLHLQNWRLGQLSLA